MNELFVGRTGSGKTTKEIDYIMKNFDDTCEDGLVIVPLKSLADEYVLRLEEENINVFNHAADKTQWFPFKRLLKYGINVTNMNKAFPLLFLNRDFNPSLIIIDELDSVSDPIHEMTVSAIATYHKNATVLASSAVIENIDDFVKWLNFKVIKLPDNKYNKRNQVERLRIPHNKRPHIVKNVLDIGIGSDIPRSRSIVIVPSKKGCVDIARNLDDVSFNLEREIQRWEDEMKRKMRIEHLGQIDNLTKAQAIHLSKKRKQTLDLINKLNEVQRELLKQKNVLVEHAGFSYNERNAARSLWTVGIGRYYVATNVISRGVTLPATDLVIVEPHKKYKGKRILSDADLINISGRVGRVCAGTVFWLTSDAEFEVPRGEIKIRSNISSDDLYPYIQYAKKDGFNFKTLYEIQHGIPTFKVTSFVEEHKYEIAETLQYVTFIREIQATIELFLRGEMAVHSVLKNIPKNDPWGVKRQEYLLRFLSKLARKRGLKEQEKQVAYAFYDLSGLGIKKAKIYIDELINKGEDPINWKKLAEFTDRLRQNT